MDSTTHSTSTIRRNSTTFSVRSQAFAEHLTNLRERKALEARVRVLQPDVACLLSSPLCLTPAGQIDRWLVEQTMVNPTVLATLSLEAALVSDSLRAQARIPAMQVVDPSLCDFTGVNWFVTLPNLHQHVQNLSYFSPLSTIKDAMEYLLSKVINQRCQGRKYSTVLLRYLRSSIYGPALYVQLRALILCSLLGNYLHVPASARPTGLVRAKLYEVFRTHSNTPVMKDWILRLVEHCSSLVEYCLRDYLIYAILDNPPLHARLKDLMTFHRFQPIVTDGMNRVRVYFQQNLCCIGVSSLWASLQQPLATLQPWQQDIDCLLHPTHASMLQISYRRPNHHVGPMVICARRKIKLIPPKEPVIVVKQEVEDSEDEEEEEKVEELVGVSLPVPIVELVKRTPSLSLLPYLSMSHYKALQGLVLLYGPHRPGLIQALLPSLQDLGVSKEVLLVMQSLLSYHHEHGGNTNSFRTQLMLLASRQPHAYNLLQGLAEVQHELQRVKHLYTLPARYVAAQMKAQQERFGLPADRLLTEQFDFVFCDVCESIYSLFRCFHSPFKEAYKYGYRDAEVDYTTNETFCSHKKKVTNQRGTCGDRPLIRIPLLGEVYRILGKTVLLCPQYQCGMPFVLNTRLCMHNERGWGCCECTMKVKHGIELTRNVKQSCMNPAPQCVVCERALTKPESTFMYPCGVFLCSKHHSHMKGLTAYMEPILASNTALLAFARKEELCMVCWLETRSRWMPGFKRMLCMQHQRIKDPNLLFRGPLLSKARVTACILAFRRTRKQEMKMGNEVQAKRSLAAFKFSNRMKR